MIMIGLFDQNIDHHQRQISDLGTRHKGLVA